jgi:glycerol-3-phosphate O-acyltransferase
MDEIYTVPEDRRPRLAYYRNNCIHLYVAEGLVALALLGASKRGLVNVEDLRQRTLKLSRLLKLEFSYRVGESFEAIFDRTLAGLKEARLIAAATHGVHPAPGAASRLALLAGQISDFVESYFVAARGLESLTAPTSDKDLVRRIHDLGEKMFFTGEVRRREACVRANYANAIAYFKERGIIVEKDKKLTLAPGADARRTLAEIADLLPPAT